MRYDNPPRDEEHREAAAQVLWLLVSKKEGLQPGSFFEKLILAACNADQSNLGRLKRSFPAIAWAVYQYKNVDGGIDVLREMFRGE